MRQTNQLVRELKFNLTQMLSMPNEKYIQLQLDKPKKVEVIPNTNRLCLFETKGCGSPILVRIESRSETSVYPSDSDIIVMMSMKQKEPSFDGCQKKFIN